MSWRDLEGKRIEQVRSVDEQEVVLQLEGGHLAKIHAEVSSTTGESKAQLQMEIQKATPPGGRMTEEEDHMVKDPVCQMTIEPEHAAATSEYKGKTYYFCAVGCKTEFDRDPEQYAGAAEAPASS